MLFRVCSALCLKGLLSAESGQPHGESRERQVLVPLFFPWVSLLMSFPSLPSAHLLWDGTVIARVVVAVSGLSRWLWRDASASGCSKS